MQKRIIDKRIKEKFLMDDEYLNGQAKICGWQATLVYTVLCRHASKNQECFPSIMLMAEKLNISRPTVIKGLQNLEKYNVIQIIKNRNLGQWINNTYILIDKSEWKKHQVNEVDTVHQVNENTSPSQREYKNQVNDVDSKETHIKETHIRKHILSPNGDEVEIIPDLLKDKQKHIRIIGLYAHAKQVIFTNKKHQSIFIRRNLKPASNLVSYKTEKIMDTMAWLVKNANFKWTIESVEKYIDENLINLKNKGTTFV